MQRSDRRETSHTNKSGGLKTKMSSGTAKGTRPTLDQRQLKPLIDSFLTFSTKALGWVVKLKDVEALQNELKNDYIITKELSNLSGNIALRCGRLLAVANTFLITAKHVDFSAEEPHHPSRDSDGYPLAGLDEVPTAEQSSANVE